MCLASFRLSEENDFEGDGLCSLHSNECVMEDEVIGIA